jgi:hypothetical protein
MKRLDEIVKNKQGKRMLDEDEIAELDLDIGGLEYTNDFDGTLASANKLRKERADYIADMKLEYKKGNLDPVPGDANREKFLRGKFEEMEASGDKRLMTRDEIEELAAFDDLPPPGSRGGPDDIAAPFTGAGLEAIKNVKNSNLIVDDIVNKIYLNAGVAENAQPVVRANAREFLNRIKDLEDPEFPGGTTLSGIMEADDFKFMTEGGGGGMGDPFLLVQKYFGPKVASSIAKLDSPDDIQKFAENLVKIKDARGNSVTSRYFDPESVSPDDFEFADGGRVPMFMGGAARIGYQALRKYGIEAKDISRLFASLGSDKSLVGKEKTMYFKQLNQVLKNPDDFPDGIREIQIRLGIDPIGFKSGGLAGILEV